MTEKKKLKWIESGGGPLILIPNDSIKLWEGTNPPSDGKLIDANFRFDDYDAPATDYDRACDIESYLGVLNVGDSQGLVLWDEPLPTAWIKTEKFKKGFFVRWVYAKSEKDVVFHLNQLSEDDFSSDEVKFVVSSSPLILIDAAESGNNITGNYLKIDLPKGEYAVQTADYEPEKGINLIVHHLLKMD